MHLPSHKLFEDSLVCVVYSRHNIFQHISGSRGPEWLLLPVPGSLSRYFLMQSLGKSFQKTGKNTLFNLYNTIGKISLLVNVTAENKQGNDKSVTP